MKYKRRILEVTMEQINLRVAGNSSARTTQHLVTGTLRYPRPAIAEKVLAKPVGLDNGAVDLSAAGWMQRILFKETVQGPFGIGIDITTQLSDSQAGKLITAVSSAFLSLAGGEAADIAGEPWAAGLVRTPFDYLRKALSSSRGAAPRLVGAGSIDLCADTRWQAGAVRKVNVPLTAVEDIYTVRRSRHRGTMQASRKKLLKTGEANGEIRLSVRTYD